jgi:hypothetical protein
MLVLVLGCGGDSLAGTYHHMEGGVTLELTDGEEASIQMLGETVICTYTATKERVTLDCPNANSIVQRALSTLTRNEDGTLTAMMGVLAKRPS